MQTNELDPSLAFTAQLELQPGLSGKDGEKWRADLLAAWYAQDAIPRFWEFARIWQAGIPPRLAGEYVAKLRRVAELKTQARQVEAGSLHVRNMLREAGATEALIRMIETLAWT